MYRLIFYAVLIVLLTRALAKLWGGLREGMSGRPPGSSAVPRKGVQMVRDPVCGTFVVPSNAFRISDGQTPVYFCSASCRDKYRRTA
jgi:YHS domain-containing protein